MSVKRKRTSSTGRRPKGQVATEGMVLRPQAEVLADESLIPSANLIRPAPNQFTHELTRAQPFYYATAQAEVVPDGELPVGTKVTLLVYDGGAHCRVVDGQGLYVEIEYDSLRKL